GGYSALCRAFRLLLLGQLVAEVLVGRAARPGGPGILDQQQDRDGAPAARTEDLAALLPGLFTRRTLVPPQVEAVDRAELVDQTPAEPVGGVAVDVPAVGHEADHALVVHPVRSPTDRKSVV